MKTVSVIISGQGEDNIREVDLSPGSTAGDVLRALNLPESYLVSREGTAQPFALEEEIYAAVPEGAKLRCVPQATVGTC